MTLIASKDGRPWCKTLNLNDLREKKGDCEQSTYIRQLTSLTTVHNDLGWVPKETIYNLSLFANCSSISSYNLKEKIFLFQFNEFQQNEQKFLYEFNTQNEKEDNIISTDRDSWNSCNLPYPQLESDASTSSATFCPFTRPNACIL